MDQNFNKKNLRETLLTFGRKNKLKIASLPILIIVLLTSLYFLKENQREENLLLSEKYVKANLFLANGNIEEAKDLYIDIIKKNNKFYSLLALNTVIEKKLINNKKLVISFFEDLENNSISEELKNLLLFKKALYLIENGERKLGKEILNILVDKNSKIKKLAEDLL